MVTTSNGCSLGNLIYLVTKAKKYLFRVPYVNTIKKMSNAVEKCCLDFEERSQSIRLGIPSVTKQKFITTWSWYPGISPKQEFIVNLNQKD